MASKKSQDGDDRFLKVKKDPRFWEMPDKERKIKIDKRFQSMFHDDRFKLKYTVDKRGRPVNHTSSEDLKKFYKLSDSDVSDAELEEQGGKKKKKKKKALKAELEEIQDEEEEKDEEIAKKDKKTTSKPKDTPLKTVQPKRGVKVYEEGEEKEEPSDDEEGDDEDDNDDDDSVDMEEGVSEGSEGEDDDDEEEDDDEDDDEDVGTESEDEESESDSGPDLARGKGNVETSSDEDDEDEVEDMLRREADEIVHDWGEMWKDAPRADEMSRRLAVCNMNWDRMKAKDLLALFNSFKPKDGVIFSVKIYPSEFGKERLQAEQTQVPMELAALPDDLDDNDTEEKRLYREKIRDYQFKRLRYYYAVVECDSVKTAAKIYEECDGFEYESSCSTMDLRFIPDDMAFEDEPTDSAVDVDLSSYQPKVFSSTASTTAKVELTWDETDHDRVTAFSRNFNKDELLDMDFKAYLASSSEDEEGDEEEEEQIQVIPEAPKPAVEISEPKQKKEKKKKKPSKEDQIAKYRELLQGIQDKERSKERERDMEMEITWVPGLKEKTEKLVKKKMEGKEELTPWEEFLQKKKDKKIEKKKRAKQSAEVAISDDELPADVDFNDPFFSEELGNTSLKSKAKGKKNKREVEEKTPEEMEEAERQKAEMALLMDDDEGEQHKHFNYDKIVEDQNLSKKKKKKLLKSNTPLEEDNFQVDLKDPRFDAMFTSHLYNLDPSDPGFKKTKASQSIVAEKQRRREEKERRQEQEMATKKQEVDRDGSTSTSKRKEVDPNLSLLIKNIKNKTEQFQARKKQKMS
ncbi:ESF1 homolog [Alosa pseudoharengus]|uniref:ESF1 homolog n=1 Tax=Alosa pseudoharengus TaxID=34774 RepID=UPI003F8C3CE6